MMQKKKPQNLFLLIIIALSLAIKLTLILVYQNRLTLNSDDLNYIKSAEMLIKRGIFIYYEYDDPTVFIMPLYPAFLAGIFKLFGYGLAGLQAVRIIQALLSCGTIFLIYLIAGRLFNRTIANMAAFLVAFYMPNITTPGFIMTEEAFTFLLCLLLYLSLKYAAEPDAKGFMILGFVWALATLIRPTIALYPVLFFFYLRIRYKYSLGLLFKQGMVMLLTFIVLMSPWWARNYLEYGRFIPLSASSGNPMLQGTYVKYKQTPENVVYYKLGRNSYETNQNEVATAKKRIVSEFKKDFWGYLLWFTVGKTVIFWGSPFYWKIYFNIPAYGVWVYHYFLLSGMIGSIFLLIKRFSAYILPLSVILYFNAVHCVYMAFDRYAYPLMPLMAMFCAYTLYKVVLYIKTNRFQTPAGQAGT